MEDKAMKSSFLHCQCVAAAAALLVLAPAAEASSSCTAHSGRQTTALVELYTSEGCDSCPPADRWLSSAFAPGAAVDGAAVAVPIAFHVDYWDRLGWKDRFASADWTRRQYDSARAARSDLVYTPQVLLQGRDLRDWHSERRSAAAIAEVARSPARADIMLEVTPQQGAVAVNATARVPGAAHRKGAVLFVAFASDGLVSEVKAGENAGKRLAHDHVVRALRGNLAVDAAGEARGTVVLPIPPEAGRSSTIVAFVQNTDTGDVLQSLALPIAPACSPAR
jgi:hypothetical protein